MHMLNGAGFRHYRECRYGGTSKMGRHCSQIGIGVEKCSQLLATENICRMLALEI